MGALVHQLAPQIISTFGIELPHDAQEITRTEAIRAFEQKGYASFENVQQAEVMVVSRGFSWNHLIAERTKTIACIQVRLHLGNSQLDKPYRQQPWPVLVYHQDNKWIADATISQEEWNDVACQADYWGKDAVEAEQKTRWRSIWTSLALVLTIGFLADRLR